MVMVMEMECRGISISIRGGMGIGLERIEKV